MVLFNSTIRCRRTGQMKSRSEKRYRTVTVPSSGTLQQSDSTFSEAQSSDITTANMHEIPPRERRPRATVCDFQDDPSGTWMNVLNYNDEEERPEPEMVAVDLEAAVGGSTHTAANIRALIDAGGVSGYNEECLWDDCVSPNTQVNINEFLALFVNVVDRGKVNHDTKEKLLHIISLLLPSNSGFPKTMYLLKKGLEQKGMLEKWVTHYTCQSCGAYIGTANSAKDEDILECPAPQCQCKASLKNLTPYAYVTLPLSDYIKDALESGKCQSSAIYRDNPTTCAQVQHSYHTWHSSEQYRRLLHSTEEDFVTVGVFSDSAPTAKSSTSNIWISEVAVLDMPKAKPRLHTIWNKTPKMARTWQQPKCWKKTLMMGMVLELLHLQESGITFTRNGTQQHMVIRVLFYCADSMERWGILTLAPYVGEFGCVHCETPGKRVTYSTEHNKTVQCFPLDVTQVENNLVPLRDKDRTRELACRAEELELTGQPRDHAEFVGVQGRTLLSELPHFVETQQVPVEPMHNLFEGIGKKLIEYLIFGPKLKLKKCQIQKIDARLLRTRPPHCTVRLPRSIRLFKQWKGSEFYYFYMYYCLPCIFGIVPEETFKLMAKFCTIVQYLFSGRITLDGLLQSSDNMLEFVLDFQRIFGERHVTYNMHQFACHLAEYISHLGPPDIFWAFRFESQIGHYKKHLQGPTQEQNKELAGKILFSQAAKKMEQRYLSKTESPLVKKAMRLVCHNVAVYTVEAHTEYGTAYLRGRAMLLSELPKRDKSMFESIIACMQDHMDIRALDMKKVRCFDRCTTETGIELDSTDYVRQSSRMSSLFSDNDRNVYAALKFVLVEREKKTSMLLLVALPLREIEWNYFGLDQSSDNNPNFFRDFGGYRAVTSSEIPVILPTFSAKQPVFFMQSNDLELVSFVSSCKLE